MPYSVSGIYREDDPEGIWSPVKRRVVVCDLDGTLCDVTWRVVHAQRRDWETFHAGILQDQPVVAVLTLLRALSEIRVYPLFVTGRPIRYLSETSQWLREVAKIPRYTLLMRKQGDRRMDTVIKDELLTEYLETRPDDEVLLVLEDRIQLVNMWRSRGLSCFHVRESEY